jgi:hypothetical protein
MKQAMVRASGSFRPSDSFSGPTPTRLHWVDDAAVSHCQASHCKKAFTLIERRHHCRRCGSIFCNEHSSKRMLIGSDGCPCDEGKLSRVCDACYAGMASRAESAKWVQNASGKDSTRSVLLQRPFSGGGPLGMAVCKAVEPRPGGREGAVIASVVPGGAAAKCKGLRPGDAIIAINGTGVLDFQQAMQLLRGGGTIVELTLEKGSMPAGWDKMTDREGCAYYINRELKLKSRTHPAGVQPVQTELRSTEDMDFGAEEMGGL